MENLGLIVIDEERESSYQSGKNPENRRLRRGEKQRELTGASCFKRTTPSLESYFLTRRGDYTIIGLSRRINGEPMPPITVVDMRKELEAVATARSFPTRYSAIRLLARASKRSLF